MNLIRLVRYRFFLFAGLLPFFLGQVIAFSLSAKIQWNIFWWGFAGIIMVLIAVELFNEYFDARQGGDRIFSFEDVKIPGWFFPLGITSLLLAFIVGLKLAAMTGWPVMIFAFFGFMGAYFYVGPPIRWAYRGFGETVIALCYGPFMLLGSYYIQTGRIDFTPFYVSIICGLSVFCLAILNEVPDYYQDRIVGKKNLVVRLGRKKALNLLKAGLAVVFLLLVAGVCLRKIPALALIAVVVLPRLYKSVKNAGKYYENPGTFRLAVNTAVLSHIVISLAVGLSFLKVLSR